MTPRDEINHIMEIAMNRGETIVVMTYATWIKSGGYPIDPAEKMKQQGMIGGLVWMEFPEEPKPKHLN